MPGAAGRSFRNIWPQRPDDPVEASHPVLGDCCTQLCLAVTSEVRRRSRPGINNLSEFKECFFSSNSRVLIPSHRCPPMLRRLLSGVLGLMAMLGWPCWDSLGILR